MLCTIQPAQLIACPVVCSLCMHRNPHARACLQGFIHYHDGAQTDMDEGQKLERLALEFPELSAAECGAALQAQAGNLAAAVAILDMHVSAVRNLA